jgi:isopentenyl-diphosphate Delta-isomerase
MTIEKRKTDHLHIVLTGPSSFRDITTGFEKYAFVHEALPEIDLKKVDLSTRFFGKKLNAPLLISSMVGGIPEAQEINCSLAAAAQKLGIAFAVGSQRCMIEDPKSAVSYRVRDIAPDILLFANLGAVQLNCGFGVKECRVAVESIGADALILHLNPLQEALQPEGNTDFSGLLKKIETVCRELTVPVVVKEVGCGISAETAKKLKDAGASAIDIAGAGGTCWSEIERQRAGDGLSARVASHFAAWGIPAADSLVAVRKAVPDLPLISSGGIRTGLDAAKAIALGADLIGIAAPLLKPAQESAAEVEVYLEEVIQTLRVAMFCTGNKNIPALKQAKMVN